MPHECYRLASVSITIFPTIVEVKTLLVYLTNLKHMIMIVVLTRDISSKKFSLVIQKGTKVNYLPELNAISFPNKKEILISVKPSDVKLFNDDH